MKLVAEHGIKMPRHQVVKNKDVVAKAAAEFSDTKVAMKIISQDIIHKSEANGVRLVLQGAEKMTHVFGEILDGVRDAKPVDKKALVDLILKISGLVHCHPEIEEIDSIRCWQRTKATP